MYNQEYLENLINNQIEESLALEYKSAPALNRKDQKKVNEISKDVSAFANADGGILIYGIAENEHLPEKIDVIDRNLVQREWLEQKIQDCIRPKIEGIIIHPISIDNEPDKVVYVIEIPKSTTAHQANDKKYYKRHNFNVLSMHDYEIRDVFNRVKNPKINLIFKIIRRTYKVGGNNSFMNRDKTEEETKTDLLLKVYAQNIGKVYAKYINCFVKIPEVIFNDKFELEDKKIDIEFLLENKVRDFMGLEGSYPNFTEKLGPSRFEPILPNRIFRIDSDFPKLHNFYFDHKEKDISWIIYADNSEPLTGKVNIGDIVVENEKI